MTESGSVPSGQRRVVNDQRPLQRRAAETAKQFHRRYMDSDEWQQVRNAYLTDVYNTARCEVCGADDVDLHHVSYDRLGGCEVVSDLVALCVFHHDLCHSLESLICSFGRTRHEAISKATSWVIDELEQPIDVGDVTAVWDQFLEALESRRPECVDLVKQTQLVSVEGTWAFTVDVTLLVPHECKEVVSGLTKDDWQPLCESMQAALGHGDVVVPIETTAEEAS